MGRTNFNKMGYDEFVNYLNKNKIDFKENNGKNPENGKKLITVSPLHYRLKPRSFVTTSSKPVKNRIGSMKDNLEVERFIKAIDDRIQNMGTKGVYHPKRLKPKWNSLSNNEDKLALFKKYISKKESSIGFLKLVSVNLCDKTLEAILLEKPSWAKFFSSTELRRICIEKFKRYENGKAYLRNKGIPFD